MIYSNFITTADIQTAIKQEFLNQISGSEDERIEKVMADAVSLITDYINQRFDAKSIFPKIRDWNNAIDYKPAQELSYVDTFGSTEYYTPTHWYADSNQANAAETGIVINRCWFADKLWRTDQAVTGGAYPNAEGSTWIEDDFRDPKIMRFTIDIGLFLLSRRLNPQKISTIRVDLYNQAKEWLTMVKDREITPTIANYFVPEKSVDEIRWGSNKQNSHYF
jgi:hypothetical protein